MESSVISALQEMEDEIASKIYRLENEIEPLKEDLARIRAARKAAASALVVKDLPPTGNQASRNAVAHRKAQAHPAIQKLTMKQLVKKALSEHFVNGATSRQLLNFFYSEWGRIDVVRTSFSPQLTRLKNDGEINFDGSLWTLATPHEREDEFNGL